jgi:hypothetical protein
VPPVATPDVVRVVVDGAGLAAVGVTLHTCCRRHRGCARSGEPVVVVEVRGSLGQWRSPPIATPSSPRVVTDGVGLAAVGVPMPVVIEGAWAPIITP